MWAYDFMRHAFEASFFISVMSGVLGWFLLIRQETFVAHALPHVGFTGGALALCFGVAPIFGVIGGAAFAAACLCVFKWTHAGSSRVKSENQDQIIGLVLAVGLAVGLGAIHWGRQGNSQALNLLFGDLLGLDTFSINLLSALCAMVLISFVILGRPLLFSALVGDQAEGRGIPTSGISLVFLILAGIACGICSEIAGTLLAFSLIVGPASAALRLSLSPIKGIVFSCITALILCWGSLILSWYTDLPPAFWIGVGAGVLYLSCATYKKIFTS